MTLLFPPIQVDDTEATAEDSRNALGGSLDVTLVTYRILNGVSCGSPC